MKALTEHIVVCKKLYRRFGENEEIDLTERQAPRSLMSVLSFLKCPSVPLLKLWLPPCFHPLFSFLSSFYSPSPQVHVLLHTELFTYYLPVFLKKDTIPSLTTEISC